MSQCCKAQNFDWCQDLQPVYTDENGNEYCLFHAPKGEKGISLAEFNKEVFRRIDEIREKQKENPGLICDFQKTIFEGDIGFLKYDEDKPLRNVSFFSAHFEGMTDFAGTHFEGLTPALSPRLSRGELQKLCCSI